MSLIILLCLAICSNPIFGQEGTMFYKGQFQTITAFSFVPIRITDSQINFQYVDGDEKSNYLVDTISANYILQSRYFGNAFTIGIGYFISNRVRATLGVKPHFNSFLSNKAKNGKVYGVQFDVGTDYFSNISKSISISFGANVSRIIGGFGIASGGAKIKEYLVVNENRLYDNDIGFHIIDNCWAFSPKVGLYCRANNRIIFKASSGFQLAFGRTGKMNFAGLLQDGTLKWNLKDFNSSDLDLIINNTKINNQNIDRLPYRFSGLFFDIGLLFSLSRSSARL